MVPDHWSNDAMVSMDRSGLMGKNKNANFSKSPHGPIFKFCVVIREVILQKISLILDPVNFFSVLTLLADCAQI